MDYNNMIPAVIEQATPVNVTLLVLLIVSEVMGSSDKFKNSSIFQTIVTVLKGAVAKVFPPKA